VRHLFYAAMAAYGRGEYAAAARALRPMAERGVAAAQVNLAELYRRGRGVEKDLVQAHMWLSLAARQGETEAARRLERLTPRLSADQLEQSRHLVEQWQPPL
jgi:localization factor PodJL